MDGQMVTEELESKALADNPLGDPARRRILFYLPPGHGQGADRFPAVYFLHGFPGSLAGWTNVGLFAPTVPERLDGLVARGVIPPCIGVFVDGWSALGGTQWVNSAGIGRHRDYLVEDVVAFTDGRLRTIPRPGGRAVVGKSSGGYGAWVMGATAPSVFGHIAAHSADSGFEYCYLPDFPRAAAALQGSDPAAWFEGMLRRAREKKLASDDHAVLNVIAMAASYSPAAGAPLGLELPFELATARLRPEVWARWLENDPVRFVPARLDAFRSLRSIFVDCGTRDEFNMRWGARMVVEELRAAGIGLVHEEFEDGHRDLNYRFDRSLAYLVPRMDRA
jgi:pimeloyl-ACP methyl ester carboxylesterase